MVRKSVVFISIMILLLNGISYARSTTSSFGRSQHKYYTGVVEDSSRAGIVLNKMQYTYSPILKVKAHQKIKNGSFSVVSADLDEVHRGTSVIVKVEGSTIYEIIIERWKQ